MNIDYGCGVYTITNIITGHVYVGCSTRIRRRWHQHLSLLRRGIHTIKSMQDSWNEHGEQNFRLDHIEHVDPERDALVAAEQKWMNELDPEFNIAPNAGSTAGLPMNRSTRDALLKSNIGRPCSESTKKMIGEANRRRLTGRKLSASHRAAISAGNMGKSNQAAGDKLKGRKRPPHVVAALKAGNEARWAGNVARIREAIAADPSASTTVISKRIKADWATVKKYQKEYATAPERP